MLMEVHSAGLAWARVVAEERDWRLRQGGKVVLTGMVWLAIIELVEPQLCRTCKGHGAFYSRKNKLVEDCQVCGGGGHRPRSDRSRARFCHVDYRSWRRRWQDRSPVRRRSTPIRGWPPNREHEPESASRLCQPG